VLGMVGSSARACLRGLVLIMVKWPQRGIA